MKHHATRSWMLLFLVAVATPLRSSAQAQQPPSFIVTEARRFALLAGRTLPEQPYRWSANVDQRTGHTLWDLEWSSGANAGDAIDMEIQVDQQTGKTLRYSDSSVRAAIAPLFRSGQMPTVTQAQAIAKLNELLAGLPATPGDWRPGAVLKYYGNSSEGPGEPYWFASSSRYLSELPVGGSTAHVNPYTGQVYRWQINDNKTLLAPSGPILSEVQAQQIAYSAYVQLIGQNNGTSLTAGLAWTPVSKTTTLSRLTWGFSWETPEETVIDPEFPGEPLVLKKVIGVNVDAESGEVMSAGNITGSGGVTQPWKQAPRLILLNEILKAGASDPLILALASGKSDRHAEGPGEGALRFTRQVGGRSVPFALSVAKKRLAWEAKPGAWSGIALSDVRARDLADWLNKRQKSANGTEAERKNKT